MAVMMMLDPKMRTAKAASIVADGDVGWRAPYHLATRKRLERKYKEKAKAGRQVSTSFWNIPADAAFWSAEDRRASASMPPIGIPEGAVAEGAKMLLGMADARQKREVMQANRAAVTGLLRRLAPRWEESTSEASGPADLYIPLAALIGRLKFVVGLLTLLLPDDAPERNSHEIRMNPHI